MIMLCLAFSPLNLPLFFKKKLPFLLKISPMIFKSFLLIVQWLYARKRRLWAGSMPLDGRAVVKISLPCPARLCRVDFLSRTWRGEEKIHAQQVALVANSRSKLEKHFALQNAFGFASANKPCESKAGAGQQSFLLSPKSERFKYFTIIGRFTTKTGIITC